MPGLPAQMPHILRKVQLKDWVRISLLGFSAMQQPVNSDSFGVFYFL
ncbi:hypothetical protein CFter6_0312 [Collimonas fungivorans]|uniref:Uncharacterized protein n=1 Tax=Collimonas fungivorans TaxID=158899 RepID=A0A127P5L9_9BURK|nr:hypothetical protein CFter6_0312 [Collimonas fungivorans]